MSTTNPRWLSGRIPVKLSTALCLMCAGFVQLSPATALATQATSLRTAAIQQTGVKVSGTVHDTAGNPLPGAVVRDESNPRNATMTDNNGRFSLSNVRAKQISIHYIGYQLLKVAVSDSPLSITLVEDNKDLGEVVVVGFGKQAKANLTGSVAQIKSEDLQSRPVQNVSSALQGLMPGVSVTAGQGRPGDDGSTIRVRGVGTLNNASPYILVDGVETNNLNSIDPNDIESISVLKDAASAAIYGSKASNGVILITTKRGKVGKPVVTYSGNVGFLNATRLVERLTSAEYAEMLNFALKDNGKPERFTAAEIEKFRNGSDPDNYPNTDWYDLAFKTGVQHSHSFNVTGGTETVKYMAAAGYMNQQGILESSNRERFSIRTNLDFTFSPRLTGHAGLNFINNDYDDPNNNYVGRGSDQIIRQLNIIAPWIAARKADGTYGTIGDGNPIAWLDAKQPVITKTQNTNLNLGLDYKLMEGLVASVKVAHLNLTQNQRSFLKYFRYNPNKETSPNNLGQGQYNRARTSVDVLLNYDKQWGVHGLKVLGGYHAEKFNYDELTGERKNFPNNDVTDMNAGDASTSKNGGYSRELNMLSWFGRINYDLMGKYLFEANLRADASSRFSKGHRWGYFPSFSGAWRISEEHFMENTRDWLGYLKIRASWGKLGNQDALDDYYPSLNLYNIDGKAVFNGVVTPGYYQGSYKVSTISWEKATTWGFGVDFELFKHVTGSVDFYNRKTTGIIMKVPAPKEFALGDYYDNVGALRNTGVEISLGYNNRWGDWTFGAQGNISFNQNELLNLGGVEFLNSGNQRNQIGHAYNSYYMYHADGFFATDAEAQAWMDKYSGKPGYPFGKYKFKAGDLIYADTNGDGAMTTDDRKLCNSTTPAIHFGLVLNAGWKNFDLQAIFSGFAKSARVLNSEVYGDFRGDNSHPASIWRESWTYKGNAGKMPRVSDARVSPSHPSNVMSDFWLANTSHLRLKNLQLGYTLPQSISAPLGMSKVRFYYSVENLFTIDAMKINIDPEISSERASSYPLIMTNSLGVSITF
jgi:tonB-linked outer membrane protein, susC/ragA family